MLILISQTGKTNAGPEPGRGLLEINVTPGARHTSPHCVPVAPVFSSVSHFTPVTTQVASTVSDKGLCLGPGPVSYGIKILARVVSEGSHLCPLNRY